MKDNLPREVKDTVLHEVNNVCELTEYCAKADDFFEDLEDLPLLLTQDGILRCFRHDALVFCSKFRQLLPTRPDLFLHDLLGHLYASGIEKCSNVMREFRVPDLAKFQANLFPSSWINTASLPSHQPWIPDEQGNTFPSKEWLVLLWEFIDSISTSESDDKNNSGNENKTSNILKEILTWHIIPTMHDYLVPVSMGKTVLNVSTCANSDSPQDKTRRELLVKLGCPQLNRTFLDSRFSNSAGATAVRKHYLAMIQSTEDVLGLLNQAMNGNRKSTLENHEIDRLLVFLQSDLSRLSCSLLRNLPFYQTISTTYTRLSGCNTVFEMPADVPGDDLQVLSTVTSSIFLRHAPQLSDLYRHIGVAQASSVEFYRHKVLKYFSHLTPEGRENHLRYIKNHLLNYHHDGYEAILSAMKQLSFIPDHLGALRPAKDFYDPETEEFKQFVPKEKFPSKPFDSMEWKEFLKKVGLQCTVTKDHFMQFAEQLEEQARNLLPATSNGAEEILQKSSILVSHLFGNKSLHTRQHLSQISKINFVPAANIEKSYLDIHPSHTKSILTCFSGSVTGTHKLLVWSSASLIEASAVPKRQDLVKMLRIDVTPTHQLVISHVKNIISLSLQRGKRKFLWNCNKSF